MSDDELPPPHELEQLARSLAMDGALGWHDAQVVAAVLPLMLTFSSIVSAPSWCVIIDSR